MGVSISTKALDVVALACSSSLAFLLVVQGECFSIEGLVDYSTSLILHLSDSLLEVKGVNFGSLFLEISYFSFILGFWCHWTYIGKELLLVLKCEKTIAGI